jgi:hypothetical protein
MQRVGIAELKARLSEMESGAMTMATHDVALAVAARAHGLPVVGVSLS